MKTMVGKKGGHHFHWPALSTAKEEEMVEAIHLFARALSYEMDPLLESIRSNAELLKEAAEEGSLEGTKALGMPGMRISPCRRLYYIAQQAMTARQILERAQQLSALRTKTVHGITMLDLEETLTKC